MSRRDGPRVDLTGKFFGQLEVLHIADEPYISPAGHKTIRWVCLCHACGREVTMLSNSLKKATSCGCLRFDKLRNRPKNVKACPICGKSFEAPPTGRVTCSKECASAYISKRHTGKTFHISPEAYKRFREDPRRMQFPPEIQKKGTVAALALPEGQRGPQNRGCKVWILIDPAGGYHYVTGLLPWARENYRLFEPNSSDPEAAATRIRTGFQAIASSMRGAPSRKNRPAMTYKGWRLGDLPHDKSQTNT